MLLHDHAGRAAGEGVAARRKIRPGHRLGDCAGGSGRDDALEVNIGRRTRAQRDRRRRTGHGIDGEHIADPVRHCNHRRTRPRPGLGHSTSQHALDISHRKGLSGGNRIQRPAAATSAAAGSPATATGRTAAAASRQRQTGEGGEDQNRCPKRHLARLTAAAIPPMALRNSCGR